MFFSELFPNSLQPIHRKRQVSREATDFITLDLINREENLPQWARDRMPALLKSGVVERIGLKYMLSRKYYEFVDRKGVYTRNADLTVKPISNCCSSTLKTIKIMEANSVI